MVFNFPTTITSASFVLRKYYMSLLYHFEQVYCFHKEVFIIPELGNWRHCSFSILCVILFMVLLIRKIYNFLVFFFPEPLTRNLLNGSATLEEGASRNQFPGQGKCSLHLYVMVLIVVAFKLFKLVVKLESYNYMLTMMVSPVNCESLQIPFIRNNRLNL